MLRLDFAPFGGRLPACLILAAALLGPSPACAAGNTLVRLSQVDPDGHAIAPPVEAPCPEIGCQIGLTLRVAGKDLGYDALVSFVAQGSYLAFTPRPGTTAQMREFNANRVEPLFVRRGGNGQSAALLRLLAQPPGNAVRVSTQPDVLLRVEITPAK